MKGNKAVLFIILIAIIAISAIIVSITTFYQNNQTQSGNAMSIDGIVAKKEDQRILVISGVEAEELRDLTEEEMLEGVTNAIWFSLSIDQMKIVNEYDYVRISYSNIKESFPGQANANTIKVLNEDEK